MAEQNSEIWNSKALAWMRYGTVVLNVFFFFFCGRRWGSETVDNKDKWSEIWDAKTLVRHVWGHHLPCGQGHFEGFWHNYLASITNSRTAYRREKQSAVWDAGPQQSIILSMGYL